MKNVHLKNFILRGLMFGGFGPIVGGIVFAILEYAVPNFSLSGTEVFLAIVSTYILAFVQAGVSVFNQIESWPLPKTLLCHFSALYITYTLCYLLNSWIPFRWEVIGIFTGIFVITYLVIWFTVYLIVRSTEKKLNRKLG